MTAIIPLPHVERVDDGNVSRIKPAYDWTAPPDQQVAWWAAVTALDSGLDIGISQGDSWPHTYRVHVNGGDSGPYSVRDVHHLLTGIVIGAQAARQQAKAALDHHGDDAAAERPRGDIGPPGPRIRDQW
jgi:hypothetical protein